MARRNPSDAAALDPALTQKKRARRRLVGAVVVGIAAAIVLPLVLDSEPRQTITDVEIEIPPREAALPEVDLPKPEDAAIASPGVEEIVVPPSPSEPIAQPAPSDPKAVVRADAEPPAATSTQAATDEPPARSPTAAKTPAPSQSKVPAADSKSAPFAPSGVAPSSAPKAAPTEAPKVASAQQRADAAATSSARYALQVGAFANAGSARAQLDKARRTGLRAYTEKVQTAQGERTRVRVGPFPTREAAEKARATLKLAGMESTIVDAGAAPGTR